MPPQQGDVFDRLAAPTKAPQGPSVRKPDAFDSLGAKTAPQAASKSDVFDKFGAPSPSPAAKSQSGAIAAPPQEGHGVSGSWEPTATEQLGVQPYQGPATLLQQVLSKSIIPPGPIQKAQQFYSQLAQDEIVKGTNPIRAKAASFMAGAVPQFADELNPLTVALGGLGEGMKLAQATGRGLKAAYVVSKAMEGLGAAQVGQSLPTILNPDSTWSERIGAVGNAILGGAGVAGGLLTKFPIANVADTHTPTTSPTVPEKKVPIAIAPHPEAQPAPVEVPITKTSSTPVTPERRVAQGPTKGGNETTAEYQTRKAHEEAQLNPNLRGGSYRALETPPSVNPIKDAVVQNAQKVVNDPRSDTRDKVIAAAQIADAKANPRENAGNLDLNRIRAENAATRVNPFDKMLDGIPEQKLPEFKQTLEERAKELQANAATTRQLVDLSNRNKPNAKTAIAIKATGRPAYPVTTTGPSGERVVVTDENGKAIFTKEKSEAGIHSRHLLGELAGYKPRFNLDDMPVRPAPAKIPKAAWDKAIEISKNEYFQLQNIIRDGIENANSTGQDIDDTEVPSQLKELDRLGSRIWQIPKDISPEGRRTQLPLDVTDPNKAVNPPSLWTMDKATADRLTGRKNKTLLSEEELLAHADKQDAKAAKHLELASHIQNKLDASKKQLEVGPQGGHAGGGVSSVEELNRPGRFVKISRSGIPSDQNKVPDFNLGPGEAGYQVKPDGSIFLTAGQETPITRVGVQNFAKQIFPQEKIVSPGQKAVESAGGVYKATWDNGMVEAVLPRSMTEDLPIDPRQKGFVSITIPSEHLDPEYIKNAMAAKRAEIIQRSRNNAPTPTQPVPQIAPPPNLEAEQAAARIQENTQILQQLVDPKNINSASDVDAALTNASERLKHNQDPRITVPLTAEARTRLASSLGMAEKDIFSEASGQGHSAEEITAAQMILDNSRDATLKAMTEARADNTKIDSAIAQLAKHNEIVEGIRDKFAKEAGRALQAVKKITPFDQAISDWSKMDPKAKIEAARRFVQLDPNEPGAIERFSKDIRPTMKRSAVFETYVNSLLSGAAALTKFSSDVSMLLTSLPEKFVNGLVDAIQAPIFNRPRQEFAGEALAQAHGFLDGARAGFQQFIKTFKTETSPSLIDDEFSKFDHAIKRKLGRAIRIPMRTLAAITDGFKVINYSGRLRAIAYRNAVKVGLNPFSDEGNVFINKQLINPTLKMRNEANSFANQQVLQEDYSGPGLYNETMRAVLAARSKSSLAKVVVPFAKTPGNFAREAAKFSPVGFYGTVKEAIVDRHLLKQATDSLEAAKAAQKLHSNDAFYQNKVDKAAQQIKAIQTRAFERRTSLSKNILGTGAFLFALNYALKGNITGAGPQNPKIRQALIATGWQPYSVKIGDTYVSYRRNPQAFVSLGTAADIAEAMKENPGRTNLSKRMLSGLHKTVALGTDITFLNSLSSMYRLIEGQENLAQTASYEVVPAGVRYAAHIIDSRVTDPRNAAQQFEAQIPFLSEKVPSKIDVTGQPETLLKKNLGGFNPFSISTAKDNAALLEQMRLQANTPTIPHVTGHRTGGFGTHAPRINITPDEQKILSVQDEQINNQRINAFIRNPGYRQLTDAQKREGIAHIQRQTQLSRIYRLQQLRAEQGPTK